MRYYLLCLCSVILVCFKANAQSLSSANPYYVGHSLINHNVPKFVDNLATSAGKTSNYAVQIINGAPISYNFQNPQAAEGTPYTTALPTGNYDVFIITEAVPLLNHTVWSNTYGAANDFLTYARSYRNDIRYFIYETWHCTNTGTPEGCDWDNDDNLLWQPRLIHDYPKWVKIVDSVRTLQPYNDVYMVPAGQAFHALSVEIDEGRVPGISTYKDLFPDGIHPSATGNYFVACVMYSCIFKESPAGLTNIMHDQWGTLAVTVPPDLAAKMQEVAWNVVCANSYSNVDCAGNNTSTIALKEKNNLKVFPQPASRAFNIEWDNDIAANYMLTNTIGKSVKTGMLSSGLNEIDVQSIDTGIYILTVNHNNRILTKRISVIR
jgi:hypothetical protein